MIWINPTYESLQPILSDPETLIRRATLIHQGRNKLFVAEAEGLRLCIKAYGFASAWKRFLYRYLRSSKGWRAWQNSQRLMEAGFATPEPVAYIQENAWWGIQQSYYICLYQAGQTLYRWGDQSLPAIEQEVIALAQFAARLHEANLLLCDFTPGNILLTEQGFALVDTNRMRFGHISVHQGLKNMAGLWMQPEAAALLARTYAQARGANPDECEQIYTAYRHRFWQRFIHRHHLTDRITHRDLDGSTYTYPFNTTIR